MPNEILTFDAAASGVGGDNPGTALNVGPGTPYLLREFAAPAPPQTVQYAGSVDTEGSLPASRKHENRVLTAKIMCSTAASLRTLQDKIGKVAREGGTLKWVLPNAETVIFDLLAADTFDPAFDVTWHRNAGTYCDVQVVLPAKPYGRGPSVTLSLHSETTLPALVFTETGIKGDMPALGDLALSAGATQQMWLWGIQSRYYSSASTAALFYEAEALFATGVSSTAAGPAGASGAGSNVVRNLSIGTSWTDVLRMLTSGLAPLTHIGNFRVLARVYLPNTNTGTMSLQLRWGRGNSLMWATNDSVTIDPSYEQTWRLVDLGQVNLPSTPRDLWVSGNPPEWDGMLQAQSTVSGDDLNVDCLMFIPTDEGDGQATDTASSFSAGGLARVRHDGVFNFPTSSWAKVQKWEGKGLVVPPAGAEGRTLRIILKASQAPLLTGADAAIDDMSATLTYTPRYLVVPSP